MNNRVIREKTEYDKGLNRKFFSNYLSHSTKGPAYYRQSVILKQLIDFGKNGDALEIGSRTWAGWIDEENWPRTLICVNISQTELNYGIELAKNRGKEKNIEFKIMDAHNMEFDSDSFSLVFGSGILHHLNFADGLDEIHRVLKPGGRCVFFEPLRMNPVSKLVRLLTPKARTKDECPLGLGEINCIKKKFKDSSFFYFQLFSVPAGLLSRFIFKNPVNPLTQTADCIDQLFEKITPVFRPLYRYVLICGTK